jgi:precorrin isomerase
MNGVRHVEGRCGAPQVIKQNVKKQLVQQGFSPESATIGAEQAELVRLPAKRSTWRTTTMLTCWRAVSCVCIGNAPASLVLLPTGTAL